MNNPDVWVIVKINSDTSYYRVLAGWYGGYTTGDSWKMSSGITKVEEKEDCYLFHNTSGSIYRCNKKAERTSGLTSSIFANYAKDNTDELSIEIVDYINVDHGLINA